MLIYKRGNKKRLSSVYSALGDKWKIVAKVKIEISQNGVHFYKIKKNTLMLIYKRGNKKIEIPRFKIG